MTNSIIIGGCIFVMIIWNASMASLGQGLVGIAAISLNPAYIGGQVSGTVLGVDVIVNLVFGSMLIRSILAVD